MRRLTLTLSLILLFALPILAQDDPTVCPSPFPTDTDPSQAVMTLDDVQITSDAFANRVRFEHAYNAIKLEIIVNQLTQQAETNSLDATELISNNPQVLQITRENDNPTQLGNRVLSDLAGDVVVWNYALENEIGITESLFDETVDGFFAFTDESSDEERQATLDDFSRRILASGTAPQELTIFFCRQALYDAVQAEVIVPQETTLYANAEHILVSTQEVAQDIITLIAGGEDFATLAQELSLDVPSAERGGEIGWQPAIFFVTNFADAVTTAELNTVVGPIQTEFGWHVIRVIAREDRPIDEAIRPQIEFSEFARWRGERINASNIAINPDWQSVIPPL
ncbi:MAG: peptidylprolyl isomerase [Chloroflexota bacterium]